MSIRTVKVSNISLAATEQDIKEFFSFSGDIDYVEMQSESERPQLAYVTFKDTQGADTAVLLSGATIVDLSVVITPVENYQLPPEAIMDAGWERYRRKVAYEYGLYSQERELSPTDSTVKKAEEVVSSMLAKGFVLGKDAVNKARSFDEQHHIISNATATVALLDRRIGLTEKISTGTTMVSGKVREVDERFQVSEITKSALAAAEQKASSAGSAILNNPYVSLGASWVSSTLNRVAKVAEDVSMKTKEKMDEAEAERQETICRERRGMVSEFAQLHLDESSTVSATIPVESVEEQRTGTI